MEAHRQDVSTSLAAKAEHRKRQNRLNQRALRQRKAKQGLQENRASSEIRPYRVGRWRVEASDPQHALQPPISAFDDPGPSRAALSKTPQGFVERTAVTSAVQSSSILEPIIPHPSGLVQSRLKSPFDGSQSAIQMGALATIRYLFARDNGQVTPSQLLSLYFPLSSDHLLQLIQHNALRAFAKNSSLLGETTSLIKPPPDARPVLATVDLCDGLVILQTRVDQTPPPGSLHPTSSQMKNPHLSWLDMFPSPRLRDNLIEYQETLDSWDLCYDLFGELIGNYTHISPPSVTSVASMSRSMDGTAGDYSDDVSAKRCCLIVWGEPWNEENWEITPGFLRKWAWLLQKWAWLLQGCETLIQSSNRWRAKRGEEPLQLEVNLDLGNTKRDEITFTLEVRLCMRFRHFVFANCHYSVRSWKIGRIHFSLCSQLRFLNSYHVNTSIAFKISHSTPRGNTWVYCVLH